MRADMELSPILDRSARWIVFDAGETFRAAKGRGLRCFYDLPIGHHRAGRRVLEEEAALLPEWQKGRYRPGPIESGNEHSRST